MVQILLAIALVVIVPGVVSGLIYITLARRRRESELLRYTPPPDFSFLERPDGEGVFDRQHEDAVFVGDLVRSDDGEIIPLAVDEDECLPTFDAIEPDPQPIYAAVVEPRPIFGTRATVRQAYMRAERKLARSVEAAERQDYDEAQAFALSALREVEGDMKRDHFYAPYVINWLGCLKWAQGLAVEANELWEQGEQIANEWYEQYPEVLHCLRQNIQMFHDHYW